MFKKKRKYSFVLFFIFTALIGYVFAQESNDDEMSVASCSELDSEAFGNDGAATVWIIAYVYGAVEMDRRRKAARGEVSIGAERVRYIGFNNLIESGKAFCANHPNMKIDKMASMVVDMVFKE